MDDSYRYHQQHRTLIYPGEIYGVEIDKYGEIGGRSYYNNTYIFHWGKGFGIVQTIKYHNCMDILDNMT